MAHRILDELLQFNREFVDSKGYEEYASDKYPDKKVAILCCMDTRLVTLLPAALGIKNGDAKVIRNAGAVITHQFGSVMRSILIAIYELGVEEVVVIGHDGCGLQHMNSEGILEAALKAGVSQKSLDTLTHAGIDLDAWLTGFNCVEESVKNTVQTIKNHPLMPPGFAVHGLVMNPETGAVRVICRDE